MQSFIKLRPYAIITTSFILFLCSPKSFANECDAILASGVRNTYEQLRSGNFAQNFRYAYCSNESSSSSSSSQAQLTVFDYFSIGGRGSDALVTKEQYCKDTASASSEATFAKALASVADPNIVEAWKACTTHAYGLFVNGDLNGDDLILTVKFLPAVGVTQTILQGNPYIAGAQCYTGSITNGIVINTAGVSVPCKRPGTNAVTVVLNSPAGPARFYVPSTPSAQIRKSYEKVDR